MDELTLAAALITETWLKTGEKSQKMTTDLLDGHGLNIIYKNRPRRADGTSCNRGGVAVVYDKAKKGLKNFPIKKSSHEIHAVSGRINRVHRKIGIIVAYIPPKSLARSYKSAFKLIVNTIQNFKKNMREPLIFVAGDFNKFNIRPPLESFEDVSLLDTPPTCNSSPLDRIATNMNEHKFKVMHPLQSLNGIHKSDHSTILFSADLKQNHQFVKKRITRRKFTAEGLADFNSRLMGTDWIEEFKGLHEDTDTLTDRMTHVLEEIMDNSFVMKTYTVKSTDAPLSLIHI